MATYNLADSYRQAGLTPGPEILALRQAPFDQLVSETKGMKSVDLVRLYFGQTVSAEFMARFSGAFQDSDASFSVMDNQRELSVLAACMLDALIKGGDILCAYAILTTAAAGARKPTVRADLLVIADHKLKELAISARSRSPVSVDTIKVPAKSKVPAEGTALGQSGDWVKAGELLGKVSDEGSEAVKNLATQVAGVLRPALAEIADLREETSILWWHIGGWSRLFDRPFAEFDQASGAVLAALDVSRLTRTLVGPVAAITLMHSSYSAGKKIKTNKVSLSNVVEGIGFDNVAKLAVPETISDYLDVCPVLAAFYKCGEIGSGTSWHGAYTRATGLKPVIEFSLSDLAMQVFRERQFLYGA